MGDMDDGDDWDDMTTMAPNNRGLLQDDMTTSMPWEVLTNAGDYDFNSTGDWNWNNSDSIPVPMGTLLWPNFTVELKDLSANDSFNFVFSLDAYDVFGNNCPPSLMSPIAPRGLGICRRRSTWEPQR